MVSYVYAGNNPLNRVDPDGEWWFLMTERLVPLLIMEPKSQPLLRW